MCAGLKMEVLAQRVAELSAIVGSSPRYRMPMLARTGTTEEPETPQLGSLASFPDSLRFHMRQDPVVAGRDVKRTVERKHFEILGQMGRFGPNSLSVKLTNSPA